MTLLGDDGPQFVDIRDIRELDREGRIPGAYHAPRGIAGWELARPAPSRPEALNMVP